MHRIKRLQNVECVRTHAEYNDLVLFAEILDRKRIVTPLALNNEQQVTTQLTALCMYNEVLEPRQTMLSFYPVSFFNINTPILSQILVPGLVVAL